MWRQRPSHGKLTPHLQKTTLKFKTVRELWEFKMLTQTADVAINFHERTVTCNCNEDEIRLAINKFNAQLQERKLSS